MSSFPSKGLHGQTHFGGYARLYQPMSVQVFQEMDAKMGLDTQEVY